MLIRVNCIFNDEGAWCKNTKVRRSLRGIGARCCIDYPLLNDCKFRKTWPRPLAPPPVRPKRGN